jgi:hypothetical protein
MAPSVTKLVEVVAADSLHSPEKSYDETDEEGLVHGRCLCICICVYVYVCDKRGGATGLRIAIYMAVSRNVHPHLIFTHIHAHTHTHTQSKGSWTT